MEWSKLKNIILLILAMTNLCLLFFVVDHRGKSQQADRQARTYALEYLEERGITLVADQAPEQILLSPQTVQRDVEQEAALAARLLGGEVQTEEMSAGVYRYSNDLGYLQCHSDGTFTAAFQSGALPVGEDAEQGCLELLERLDIQGELLRTEEGSFTFRQLWDGVPLFHQQVTMTVRGGCLVGMTGNWKLTGQPEVDQTRTVITPASALIQTYHGLNELGDVCSRIDAIVPGYLSSTALPGVMVLTPAWCIVTDTGSYQLNLVTGGLSRSQ